MSIHAFETGLNDAALALKNFSESRSGKRRGPEVGFPKFKNRHSRQAVTFVELAAGVDHRRWIQPGTRERVRLMLPRRAGDDSWERRHTRPRSQQTAGRDRRTELAWVHTHQPDAVREVWELCETGRAKVQALTIKFEGGRWKAVFRLRLLDGSTRQRNPGEPVRHHGGAIGVDLGLTHLVTLDRPVEGVTDDHGHVPNPRVPERHLVRPRRIDRAIARCEKRSKNRAKLVRRRQLDDKTADRAATLAPVGRYYPSSQTCSQCGARTKLALWQRTYVCGSCDLVLDRDINAARNIAAGGQRLLREQKQVASIRGETEKASRDQVRPNLHSHVVRVGTGRPRPQPFQPTRHVRAAETSGPGGVRDGRGPATHKGDGAGFEQGR